MARRTSAAMLKARQLIEQGFPLAQACSKAGANPESMRTSAWYRARPKVAPYASGGVSLETERARQLIEKGDSVPVACKAAGIHTSTIYRSEWWKARQA